MRYLTHDVQGNLTGAYWQSLHPDHASSYIEVDEATYRNWTRYKFENGSLTLLPPTAIDPMLIMRSLTDAVQAHLDATARERGYDGILSLASYAASTHPPFSAEGRAGLDWRDAVWGYCYQVLADVQAGNRAVPSADELIAELPAMVWPA